MKRILIIVVIAGLLLPSCMKYQDIKFLGVDHVRIGKLGMNESTLDMNLVFNNPNRMGATINNARGQAWIQDIYIGDFC